MACTYFSYAGASRLIWKAERGSTCKLVVFLLLEEQAALPLSSYSVVWRPFDYCRTASFYSITLISFLKELETLAFVI